MNLGVAEIIGLNGVPSSRMGVHKWLKTNAIPTCEKLGRFVFKLDDLPVSVRTAYITRLADEAGLDLCECDDKAHIALLEAPAKQQERAAENVAKLLFVAKLERFGTSFVEIERAGKKAFGSFASRNTIKNWKAPTKGIAPAN